MEIYVDGSCLNNGHYPNEAGFGIIGFDNEEINFVYSERETNSTNNRQEMKAILYCLEHFGKENPCVNVYSDSAYAVNTFSSWLYSWKAKGWRKSDDDIPENLDLVKQYYDLLLKGHKINLIKVRGHSNNEKNNLVDKLATGKITEKEIREKYE